MKTALSMDETYSKLDTISTNYLKFIRYHFNLFMIYQMSRKYLEYLK